MTGRSTLLLFVVLLVVVFAGLSSAEENSPVTLMPAPAAILSPAEISGCTGEAPAAAEVPAELPALLPEATSGSDTCGLCSLTPCKGVPVGQVCSSPRGIGVCEGAGGIVCSGTTQPKCACWV